MAENKVEIKADWKMVVEQLDSTPWAFGCRHRIAKTLMASSISSIKFAITSHLEGFN